MDATTTRLATYAAGLRFEDLPDDVVRLAVDLVVDTLGCAVGGAGVEAVRVALESVPHVDAAARALGLDGQVLGRSWTTTPEQAAFANTCMIRGLDFNDRYPSIHPSDMIGALLAVAGGVDGRRLVTAVVAAYEVGLRVADAIRRVPGWDGGYPTGMGAVAGVASLLGCGAEVTGQALSLVATSNVHLRSTRAGALSTWKGAATAHATFNAVFLTRLAQHGMTGPDRAIEGRHGLWEQVTGEFALPLLPDEGGPHQIVRTSIKYWPVEYTAQNGVWAARRLAAQVPLERLASVRLGTHTHGFQEIGGDAAKWDPRTRETADHSLPYVFVRAMQGDGVTLRIFDRDAYLDPAVRPLMAKVTVEPDERCDAVHPDGVRMTCSAVSDDGTTVDFVVEDPPGFWSNPMSREQVHGKFTGLVEPVLGAERAAQAHAFWAGLLDRADLAEGLRLLELP